MFRFAFILIAAAASHVNPGAHGQEVKKNGKELSATVTNQGRTIQIAQDGAYVNLLMIADSKDDRRVTRLVSKPVDLYLFGIVAELRHGDTDEYSYVLIVARAPRCEFPLLRDSQTREVRGKGGRYSKITLENPESDSVEVLLESDPKSDMKPLKPTRYTNGCTRAWLFF